MLVALICPLSLSREDGREEQTSPGMEQGFTPLFNGNDLSGWTLMHGRGPGYVVEDSVLVCTASGGGNLFTKDVFEDFIFRFEFKLQPGGNNGVGIRAPLEGNPAYQGMEIQILDNDAPQYASLRPAQYHGSVYGLFPAKRGFLKKTGEWNTEEIMCRGSKVRITLNSRVIVNADLDDVKDRDSLKRHPGIKRKSGHIGFLGHGHRVEFRNIRIRDLKLNVPPDGFESLFNGKDLSGWKGLVQNPAARAGMPGDELEKAQKKADLEMRKHWRVQDGVLVFDGKGHSLCTAREYTDFELLVDWKIPPGGDSGIYLRGSPQVQIWDREVGSGGLYNNKKNPSEPSKKADNPPGEWNRFRILMNGDKVTVLLNGELVVDNVVMENYWERQKPIYPAGQIELQSHGGPLYFKNIFIRESRKKQ